MYSISKLYFESIPYGIVKMDVCQLILERSWPCDINAQHKGCGIIMSGVGRKIIFQLLKKNLLDTTIQATKQPILLTKWAEFFEEVNEALGVLALVLGGISSPTIQVVFKTVRLMLGEFWNKVLALLVSSSSSHFLWFMYQANKLINHHGVKLKQWDLALTQA
jgi:hypothetical protein